MRDEAAQLPGVDPRVRRYMDPSPAVLAAARPSLDAFAALFKFTATDEAAGRKRKHFWSDIAGAEVVSGATDGEGASIGESSSSSNSSSRSSSTGGGGGGGEPPVAKRAAAVPVVGSVDPVSRRSRAPRCASAPAPPPSVAWAPQHF